MKQLLTFDFIFFQWLTCKLCCKKVQVSRHTISTKGGVYIPLCAAPKESFSRAFTAHYSAVLASSLM